MHLPSAGMIRFRFDGFTPRRRISVRSAGHPEVRQKVTPAAAGARGQIAASIASPPEASQVPGLGSPCSTLTTPSSAYRA